MNANVLLLSQQMKQTFTFELHLAMYGIKWVFTPHDFLIIGKSFSSGIESYNVISIGSY